MFDRGKILVTGGAGFIGNALVWELNRRGIHNILIADFLERSEKWRNLAPLRFEDYLETDDLLTTLDKGPGPLAGVTTVFYLGVPNSWTASRGRTSCT